MEIAMSKKAFLSLALVAVALAACGSSTSNTATLADALPLDAQKPTFVFFYTSP
jgi:hypothetical protein